MAYYVIEEDGKKVGPIDPEVLDQWLMEGRVSPSTLLENEVSGGRITVKAMLGLAAQSMASTVPEAEIGDKGRVGVIGGIQLIASIALAVLSPIWTFSYIFGDLTLTMAGFVMASRANQRGFRLAPLAAILNLLTFLGAVVVRFAFPSLIHL